MHITFLESPVALTKSFHRAQDGTVDKQPYPNSSRFTSHTEGITKPIALYEAIKKHAALGHCLLKGNIQRDLSQESRRGATDKTTPTQWICLDFDRLESPTVDDALKRIGLGDVSYVLQYSSSHNVFPEDDGTVSAHVFMMLDAPLAPITLKSWLMELNLKQFNDQIKLSRTNSALSWPLDVTTCQNDKLLYIAAPRFINMVDPFKEKKEPRIQFVKRKNDTIATKTIGTLPFEAMRSEARAHMNMLRQQKGLDTLRGKIVVIGEFEVQNKPDTCAVTGIRRDSEFTRLNLNGGGSWAYWHPNQNFEFIHDYKTELSYKTKELIPDYYQQRIRERENERSTPTETGDLVLGFVDLYTATYRKALWNPEKQELQMFPAKNETQINHWYLSHGLMPPEFIPQWKVHFNPRSDEVVNMDKMTINLYRKSEYVDVPPNPKAKFPTIEGIILHMLGDDRKVYDHFINWFACIFQRKHKPLTAWVAHGIEGTGKGYFNSKIVRPLLHPSNHVAVTAGNIEENFNDWLEGKSFIFVDEVDINDFKEKGRVTAKLRAYITERKIMLRKMYSRPTEHDNWTAWFFGSNKRRPVHIPPSDRRYNVGIFQKKKLPIPNDEQVKAELDAFAAFLNAHPADTLKADSIIHTKDRDEIAALSESSGEEIARMISEGDLEGLDSMRPDKHMIAIHPYGAAYGQLMDDLKKTKRGTLTRDELFIIFEHVIGGMNHSPHRFSKYLRHQGLSIGPCKIDGKSIRGITTFWKKAAK